MTVAVLVKMSAGLLVIPLVVTALVQRRRRDAVILAALPSVGLAVSAAAIPGLLTNVARATGDTISEASIWRPLELATAVDPRLLTTVAGAVVLALAVAVSWRHRHDAAKHLENRFGAPEASSAENGYCVGHRYNREEEDGERSGKKRHSADASPFFSPLLPPLF